MSMIALTKIEVQTRACCVFMRLSSLILMAALSYLTQTVDVCVSVFLLMHAYVRMRVCD